MKIFKNIYFILSNTVLLTLLVLLFCHFFLDYYLDLDNKHFYESLSDVEKDSYRHMEKNNVEKLLYETWSPGWRYEEFTGFSEKLRSGEYVNVSEYGFRGTRSEISDDIWFFGGSTTFGYGVADWETIPARVEEITGLTVVNFGRADYYSEQENALFSKLLVSGIKPKIAVFLDGFNERCEISAYQKTMTQLFENASARYTWKFQDIFHPVLVLKDKIYETASKKFNIDIGEKNPNECSRYGNTYTVGEAFRKNMGVRKALCEMSDVSCFTFLQPISGVDGIHEDYYRWPEHKRTEFRDKKNQLYDVLSGTGVVDISDSLNKFSQHCYVDDCHYNQESSLVIAKRIASHIDAKN